MQEKKRKKNSFIHIIWATLVRRGPVVLVLCLPFAILDAFILSKIFAFALPKSSLPLEKRVRGRSLQGPRAVEPRHRRLVGENGVRRIRGKRKLLEWGVEALGANAFGECSV